MSKKNICGKTEARPELIVPGGLKKHLRQNISPSGTAVPGGLINAF